VPSTQQKTPSSWFLNVTIPRPIFCFQNPRHSPGANRELGSPEKELVETVSAMPACRDFPRRLAAPTGAIVPSETGAAPSGIRFVKSDFGLGNDRDAVSIGGRVHQRAGTTNRSFKATDYLRVVGKRSTCRFPAIRI